MAVLSERGLVSKTWHEEHSEGGPAPRLDNENSTKQPAVGAPLHLDWEEHKSTPKGPLNLSTATR